MSEAWLIEKVAALEVGESAPPFHRYRDGWWFFWPTPSQRELGRILATEKDLRNFMAGHVSLGKRIAPFSAL